MGKFIDLTGKTYGKLTVIRKSNVEYPFKWECRCDCGKFAVVNGIDLQRKHTKSCGCLCSKHEMSGTRFYRIWGGMKGRCLNSNHPKVKDYGGRGIKVCDKWLAFNGFWEDMCEGYSNELTIERIDVNGNYEKSNCRWATWLEQGKNKRDLIIFEYKNETHNLREWSILYGIKYRTLHQRIKYNWSIEKALTTPTK